MPGYATHQLTVRLSGHDYRIEALSDLQQFADPDGTAARAGISSAQWSLFGQVWPAGRALAEAMAIADVDGKRILEIGCGLGLSSLVLQRRRAEVVASDHHPLAGSFLDRNAWLNGLPPVTYRNLPWATPDATLGRFDLIIGSDVLYERGHAAQLVALMQRHAHPDAQVLISDPGRGNSGAFSRGLAECGYSVSETRSAFAAGEVAPFRGRVLDYRRGSAGLPLAEASP
ncbi:class I SAM-dependent methyltransferase [Dokdonella koreensis]|uniref:Type 12 methyltransferase n=1 Tax=Dokdonella koreensis DS-123 TaxID=1300342 RepID=A0A160DTV7_9GAMM|nr:methyltransferase domain-containing protein [Dokdonella koreensis]ANB17063.1 Type 12 methyltransferase [Dokdonella koreensis DS-123]